MKQYIAIITALLLVWPAYAASKKNKQPSLNNVAISYLDNSFQQYDALQKQIWANPELGFLETFSSSLLQKHLVENGFDIETGVAGMPTAFVATYGSGEPVIGILAEFDALPDCRKTQFLTENHWLREATGMVADIMCLA